MWIVPYLHDCRDVTDSKSIQDGAACGRLRVITPEKTYANTPVKSHNRQAKDSICILHEGRYLLPGEKMLKALLSIPQEFTTDCVGSTIATEIIGQSVEYGVVKQLMAAVKQHVVDNVGACTVSEFR